MAYAVLVNIADAIRFEKGLIKRSVLLESIAGTKETKIKNTFKAYFRYV